MSRRVIQVLTDDLDGSDADDTVKFGIDGVEYEIDLSLANANQMREVFRRYVDAGRRVGRMASGGRQRVVAPGTGRREAWLDRATGSTTYDPAAKQERADVRDWSRQHGVHVPDRGRIKQEIMDAFTAKDPTMLPGYDPARDPSRTANGNGRGATTAVPAAAFSGH